MKRTTTILLCIGLGIALMVFPFVLNYVILQPSLFPYVGEPVNWLMFWPTYLGAAASFIMILVTWRTLCQNEEQLQELKKQWEEEHTPEIIAFMFGYEQLFYIRIKNISNVTVKNISINITREPIETIVNYDIWKHKLISTLFSIEPRGYRDIQVPASFFKNENYNDFFCLKFTYNEKYNYETQLSFNDATIIDTRFEEDAILSELSKLTKATYHVEMK